MPGAMLTTLHNLVLLILSIAIKWVLFSIIMSQMRTQKLEEVE